MAAVGGEAAASVRLLGPREFRALFPYPVDVVNTGLNLVAVGPANEDGIRSDDMAVR
jgi:hypothetical protein